MEKNEKKILESEKVIVKVDENNIFIESAKGKSPNEILDNLQEYSNIRLTVVNFECLSGDEPLVKLKKIFNYLTEAKISLHVLNQGLTPRVADKIYYQVMVAAIDYECRSQEKRTRELLKRGRTSYGVGGRPQIEQDIIANIQKLYQQKRNFREIAEMCQVSLGTAYKYSKLSVENH